jgi:glycosyltransferase involved in cell wall biosynthesis
MKILWAKANKLLPVHSGGDIRSYNLLRVLAESHEVTLLSYYDGPRDHGYEEELKRHFPAAVCVWTGKGEQDGLTRGLDYVRNFPSQRPYAVGRFTSSQVRGLLETWFRVQNFDVTVCDFLDAAVNFPETLTIPSVLFQHNVESEIWRRHALTATGAAKKILYRTEFARMLHYEQTMVSRFHHVIAVSEHDRELMSAWVDASRITVVPTGVDLRLYRPAAPPSKSSPLVMFVGAMDWEPNIDAAEHFCRNIWPTVLAEGLGARFRLVGRNPNQRVLNLASDSVEVTGSVPSVVEHLHEAAVVVVPLRIGGGTRLKIYEAMATGRAVVSTSVGAEGLDVHHGRDIWLADDADSFSRAVITLLKDREIRQKYERAATALASQHDWPAIGMKFDQVLRRVAGANSEVDRALQLVG